MTTEVLNETQVRQLPNMTIGTYRLNALNDEVRIPVSDYSTLNIDVRGTYSATIVVESSIDGLNWLSLPILSVSTGAAITTIVPGRYTVNISAGSINRVRFSAYTSGTATVMLATNHSVNAIAISNSSTNPISVSPTTRLCTGRQTLSVTTGAVTTLTPPANSVTCFVQADGTSVSITLDGTTPTATVGSRIDDGIFFYVDTALANVKLIARVATTNVQVVYFDRA